MNLQSRRVKPKLSLRPTVSEHPSRPDEHWLVEAGSQTRAKASIWWRDVPHLPNQRVGVIGHYSAACDESARTLLEVVTQRLWQQGCTIAIGPMDGTTWRPYRFVTEAGTEPPFFLEPNNPEHWPQQWRWAGFETLAQYFSAATSDIKYRDPIVEERGAQLYQRGVRLRPLRLNDLVAELHLLHALSLQCFATNYLFSPMSREEFVAQGQALRNHLRAELILIAERDTEALGFVFALPNPTPVGAGAATAIIKTLAVLPPYRERGLGSWLVDQAQQAAAQLGFNRVIHALMHQANPSLKVSARYANIFRRYELFAKKLKE